MTLPTINFKFPAAARAYRLICCIAIVFAASPLQAQFFVEGDDYTILPGDARVQADGRVEVNEFFWYGCPSCFRFEPALLNWIENQKPASINFVPVPATLNSRWEFHARAHYAFDLIGLHKELSEKFYNEIHINKNRVLTPEELAEWAAKQDVDVDLLVSSLSSFATNTKLNQADLLARKYQIQSVPTLVVGEKYVTSPSMAGSSERALSIVEYLADKILAEQQ